MIIEFDSDLGRYIIVDENTGEILDNAQGYGYRTKEGARKAYFFNLNREKYQNESKIIVEWWNNHKTLYNKITDDLFYYTDKYREKLSTKELKECLNKYQDFNDAPYDPYKMFKYHDSSYKLVKQMSKKIKNKNKNI